VEIGGFGITPIDDLLYVERFLTVTQRVTIASVVFDDIAVADFFDAQVDADRKPEQFARIWIHTHPSESAIPSSTDQETFDRVFGRCDWAVMFILARSDQTFARLQFNVGPGGQLAIPVEVDYCRPFGPSDRAAWEAEYRTHIKVDQLRPSVATPFDLPDQQHPVISLLPYDWFEEPEAMLPDEQQFILEQWLGQQDTDESEAAP